MTQSCVDVQGCVALGSEPAVPAVLHLQVRSQGLGAQTTAVLTLHFVLTLGIRRYCSTFVDKVRPISALMPVLRVPWRLRAWTLFVVIYNECLFLANLQFYAIH